jgi:trimethylamine--corrinoid protein Co-methyltransferase
MDPIRPQIQVLTEDQCRELHRQSLEVLGRIGVRVDDTPARSLLERAGCRVEDVRVLIPEEVVTWALDQAPESVDVYDRRGELRFTVGGPGRRPARFGIGVTNLYYQDPRSGRVDPFSLEHLRLSVRLGNALDQFDLVSTPGVLQDLPAHAADRTAALEMAANTTKPLVLLVSDESSFEPVLDLLEEACGDLAARPWVLPYVNPISPLVINAETVRKMAAAVNRRLPLIYNSYGMGGATVPIAPGSALAMLNAELLAGLVLAQAMKPGTPVILGMLPAGFDMRTMVSLYTPHTMLLNVACAEMMAFYGIPHSGTSGSGPGWGPDLLAAGCLWMNHLTACLGKIGLAPFVGGNFDSLVFCPMTVVYADEVIRQARQLAEGVEPAETATLLEELGEVGPGGNFLGSRETFRLFRSLGYESPIWPHLSLERWREEGEPAALERLRAYTLERLSSAPVPDDHDAVLERGRKRLEGLKD